MNFDQILRHISSCQEIENYECFSSTSVYFFSREYEDLKLHFRRKHFLCEEDDCINEKFTHAFRSKIDLQAHIAQSHNRSMSKAQARQVRTLDVDFQFAPRGRHDRGTSNNLAKGRGGRDRDHRGEHNLEPTF